jgi:hypothetical protein
MGALKKRNVKSLSSDCEKLSEISPEGCESVKNIQETLGGSITMLSANDNIKTSIKKGGLDSMLPLEPLAREITENTEVSADGEVTSYKCKKEWELDALPFSKPKWFDTNPNIKKIIIDVSALPDISKAMVKLKQFRAQAENHDVSVEIKM